MLPLKSLSMFEKVKEVSITSDTFFGGLLSADMAKEKWNEPGLLIKINSFLKRTQKLGTPILTRLAVKYNEYLQETYDSKIIPRSNFPVADSYEEFCKEYKGFITISDIDIQKYFDSVFTDKMEDSPDYAKLSFVVHTKDGDSIQAVMHSNDVSSAMVAKIHELFSTSRLGNSRVFTNIASYILYTSSQSDLENEDYIDNIMSLDLAETNARGYMLSLAGSVIGKFLEQSSMDMFKNFF